MRPFVGSTARTITRRMLMMQFQRLWRGQYDQFDQQRGQSTVELALVLPFLFMMLLAVVQIGLLVQARLLIIHAAREAAREAAVGGDDNAVRVAAEEASGLDVSRLQIQVFRIAGRVTVKLSYSDPTKVPMIGSLLGDVLLSTQTTMRIESNPT
ncbi:MAG: pilus assembly protein [Acidimicrobiaceae bacterium]|nr:pilus assembly protein [Acidimicrobiaceae bacterium]